MIGGRTFQRIFKEGVVDVTEIWVDTQTGVHYLFHASGNAGGLTPLLRPDGKPIIQQGAAEE